MLAVGAVVFSGPVGVARQSTLVESLHAGFLTADRAAFSRAFADHRAFEAALPALTEFVREGRDSWQPTRIAFGLDVSLRALDRYWPAGRQLLLTARRGVTDRTVAPGKDPELDRFERTFHRAALAILVSREAWVEAEQYVRSLGDRVGPVPKPGRDVLVDPRWPLILGWAAEARTQPKDWTDTQPMPSLVGRTSLQRQDLEIAARRFEAAAAFPDAPIETHVRGAFVLHRLDRNREAAVELARAPREHVAADRVLAYWRDLIAGRIHEALDQPAIAETDYAGAVEAFPQAQTAALALGSLLERRGRSAEAERVIARVRALPPTALDPWWLYWMGDKRWVEIWLDELREMRP